MFALRRTHALALTALAGVIVPLAGSLVLRRLFPEAAWRHEPFHSALEALGAFAGLTLAFMLLLLRRYRPDQAHHAWTASALVCMGVLDGMHANALAFAGSPVHHLPYVEPEKHAGRGLLAALAAHAALVVTDRFPCFFLPRMVETAAARLPVRLESVDGNGLLPLACHPKDFSAAAHFRRHAQRLADRRRHRQDLLRPLLPLGLPVPPAASGLR